MILLHSLATLNSTIYAPSIHTCCLPLTTFRTSDSCGDGCRTFTVISVLYFYCFWYDILSLCVTQCNANSLLAEPRRVQRRPEWGFGEEIRERSDSGGMDWFLYSRHVLHERIYPFVERIQETGHHCWLVEENAGNHTTAARVDRWETERRRIHRIPKWLANSPDLHEIEPGWNNLKDSMPEYEFIGSSQNTREQVKQIVLLESDRMPQELVDWFCMNFHLHLQQVRAWGGDNIFNAS